jgi:hypothetical protein
MCHRGPPRSSSPRGFVRLRDVAALGPSRRGAAADEIAEEPGADSHSLEITEAKEPAAQRASGPDVSIGNAGGVHAGCPLQVFWTGDCDVRFLPE